MGIFDKIFKGESEGAKNETKQVPWNQLTALEHLEKLKEESNEKTVAILKHSTRCGISRMVLRQFESNYNLDENANIKLYFLDLLSYRDISNQISERFKVQHESPQLIVLQDGEVVHHASHQGIDAEKLAEFVN